MSFFPHHQQNSHFVGMPSQCAPFNVPWPAHSGGFSPPLVETPTQHSKGQETINVDSGDEVVRTEKRILWTPEEDLRLVSLGLSN